MFHLGNLSLLIDRDLPTSFSACQLNQSHKQIHSDPIHICDYCDSRNCSKAMIEPFSPSFSVSFVVKNTVEGYFLICFPSALSCHSFDLFYFNLSRAHLQLLF